MLYNMTFLSNEDLAKLKEWLTIHPHYLHLQRLGVIMNEPGKDTSS